MNATANGKGLGIETDLLVRMVSRAIMECLNREKWNQFLKAQCGPVVEILCNMLSQGLCNR